MRRAMTWAGLVLCAAALLPAGRTSAAMTVVNGAGIIDYTRKPDFKVGDYVRYRYVGRGMSGTMDDYTLTILIAGEESFWGEDGFWVETWTDLASGPAFATATFMSYSIFDDSLPVQRMQLYQRKQINELDGNDLPIQVVTRRPASSLKLRSSFDQKIKMDVDSLGADTVSTPLGLYHGIKVSERQGKSATHDEGDSTEYTEMWDKRVKCVSRQIPITSLLREEIETSVQLRKWRIGRSEEAPPLRYVDRTVAEVRLVGFGSGEKSRMLTEAMQKPLPRKAAQAAPKKAPSPTKKSS